MVLGNRYGIGQWLIEASTPGLHSPLLLHARLPVHISNVNRLKVECRHKISAAQKELLRSHDELRAAIIIAGKRIRKLQFGRRKDDLADYLRKVLRQARTVRRKFVQR
jgi:hypothetical protein